MFICMIIICIISLGRNTMANMEKLETNLDLLYFWYKKFINSRFLWIIIRNKFLSVYYIHKYVSTHVQNVSLNSIYLAFPLKAAKKIIDFYVAAHVGAQPLSKSTKMCRLRFETHVHTHINIHMYIL